LFFHPPISDAFEKNGHLVFKTFRNKKSKGYYFKMLTFEGYLRYLMSTDFILSVILSSLGFIGYYFSMNSEGLFKRFYPDHNGVVKGTDTWVVYQRICGVAFLGIIPALIVILFFNSSFYELGINFKNPLLTFGCTIGLLVLVIFMNSKNGGTKENLVVYPQIRSFPWAKKDFITNSWSWIAYLIAYEFLFRGILFFGTVYFIGLTEAVILNAAIYALVHIPKGMKETLGAIPLGIVLCIISYHTGNIWTALLVHVGLALSNDYFSHKAQVRLLNESK
jgi:membrane protease YdiL (CAAX protease family)